MLIGQHYSDLSKFLQQQNRFVAKRNPLSVIAGSRILILLVCFPAHCHWYGARDYLSPVVRGTVEKIFQHLPSSPSFGFRPCDSSPVRVKGRLSTMVLEWGSSGMVQLKRIIIPVAGRLGTLAVSALRQEADGDSLTVEMLPKFCEA